MPVGIGVEVKILPPTGVPFIVYEVLSPPLISMVTVYSVFAALQVTVTVVAVGASIAVIVVDAKAVQLSFAT